MFIDPLLHEPDLAVLPILLRVARQVERRIAGLLLTEFALKRAQWRVLAFACSHEAAIAADICSAFDADRAEVSRAVDHLEAAGLIERRRNPDYRQRPILCATQAGRALFERASARCRATALALMGGLSAQNRQSLDLALRSLSGRLGGPAGLPFG